MTLRTCLVCGEPSNGSRCDDHRRPNRPKVSSKLGYDWTWIKLSKRARALQPFCLDCGTTEDLQCDHSPEAWKRKAEGKPIRLSDVAVRCGPCNRAMGSARGENVAPRGSQTPRGAGENGSLPAPRAKADSENGIR